MTSSTVDYLRNLTAAFLLGPWTAVGLGAQGRLASSGPRRWLPGLVRRLLKAFGTAGPPSPQALYAFLKADPKLGVARQTFSLHIAQFFWLETRMRARGPAASWQVPALTTVGQVADWLGIPGNLLDWLADRRGLNDKAAQEKLRHYTCRWIPRRRGRPRLLEAPKSLLKSVQRRIHAEILRCIPSHEAVHGFRRGHSILTYARPHVGKDIVIRFDLRDFFTSVPAARVQAVFVTAGYPRDVARMLTCLCTSRVPSHVLEERPGDSPTSLDPGTRDRLRRRHLPQGAPTSPALANLCAYRLDVRLQALAQRFRATYTRYADDLAFSGGVELERAARRFQVLAAIIAGDEGFELHTRKSRFMRQGVCQHVAGVVLNVRPNVHRESYDLVKATLWNCLRHGPVSQNRAGHDDFRAHLLGRIAHVALLHAERGRRLKELFDRIEW